MPPAWSTSTYSAVNLSSFDEPSPLMTSASWWSRRAVPTGSMMTSAMAAPPGDGLGSIPARDEDDVIAGHHRLIVKPRIAEDEPGDGAANLLGQRARRGADLRHHLADHDRLSGLLQVVHQAARARPQAVVGGEAVRDRQCPVLRLHRSRNHAEGLHDVPGSPHTDCDRPGEQHRVRGEFDEDPGDAKVKRCIDESTHQLPLPRARVASRRQAEGG